MEASATAVPAHESHPLGALTVLAIVGSAVLSGVGILGLMYWLLTQQWLYFLSLGPLSVGAYLLFTRATGADRA